MKTTNRRFNLKGKHVTHPIKGDPILSIDGSRVVATWAVDIEMLDGHSFWWSWHNPTAMFEPPAMRFGPNGAETKNLASIVLDYASPAARVWRVASQRGDTESMFRPEYFQDPRSEIDTHPAGAARALEVVLASCKMDPETERVLKYQLEAKRSIMNAIRLRPGEF